MYEKIYQILIDNGYNCSFETIVYLNEKRTISIIVNCDALMFNWKKKEIENLLKDLNVSVHVLPNTDEIKILTNDN